MPLGYEEAESQNKISLNNAITNICDRSFWTRITLQEERRVKAAIEALAEIDFSKLTTEEYRRLEELPVDRKIAFAKSDRLETYNAISLYQDAFFLDFLIDAMEAIDQEYAYYYDAINVCYNIVKNSIYPHHKLRVWRWIYSIFKSIEEGDLSVTQAIPLKYLTDFQKFYIAHYPEEVLMECDNQYLRFYRAFSEAHDEDQSDKFLFENRGCLSNILNHYKWISDLSHEPERSIAAYRLAFHYLMEKDFTGNLDFVSEARKYFRLINVGYFNDDNHMRSLLELDARFFRVEITKEQLLTLLLDCEDKKVWNVFKSSEFLVKRAVGEVAKEEVMLFAKQNVVIAFHVIYFVKKLYSFLGFKDVVSIVNYFAENGVDFWGTVKKPGIRFSPKRLKEFVSEEGLSFSFFKQHRETICKLFLTQNSGFLDFMDDFARDFSPYLYRSQEANRFLAEMMLQSLPSYTGEQLGNAREKEEEISQARYKTILHYIILHIDSTKLFELLVDQYKNLSSARAYFPRLSECLSELIKQPDCFLHFHKIVYQNDQFCKDFDLLISHIQEKEFDDIIDVLKSYSSHVLYYQPYSFLMSRLLLKNKGFLSTVRKDHSQLEGGNALSELRVDLIFSQEAIKNLSDCDFSFLFNQLTQDEILRMTSFFQEDYTLLLKGLLISQTLRGMLVKNSNEILRDVRMRALTHINTLENFSYEEYVLLFTQLSGNEKVSVFQKSEYSSYLFRFISFILSRRGSSALKEELEGKKEYSIFTEELIFSLLSSDERLQMISSYSRGYYFKALLKKLSSESLVRLLDSMEQVEKEVAIKAIIQIIMNKTKTHHLKSDQLIFNYLVPNIHFNQLINLLKKIFNSERRFEIAELYIEDVGITSVKELIKIINEIDGENKKVNLVVFCLSHNKLDLENELVLLNQEYGARFIYRVASFSDDSVKNQIYQFIIERKVNRLLFSSYQNGIGELVDSELSKIIDRLHLNKWFCQN